MSLYLAFCSREVVLARITMWETYTTCTYKIQALARFPSECSYALIHIESPLWMTWINTTYGPLANAWFQNMFFQKWACSLSASQLEDVD